MKTIIFLTSYYLKYASEKALLHAKENARLVLIASNRENIPTSVKESMHEIFYVEVDEYKNMRAVLVYDECKKIIANELKKLNGDSEKIKIYCQEECHVLHAAQLRTEFSISGDKTEMVELFRNKIKMKQQVARYGIKVPKYQALEKTRLKSDPRNYYDEIVTEFKTPIVIKPINAAGSFGVAIVNNYAEFSEEAKNILDSKHNLDYEVDEFIRGQMHECDSWVQDGIVRFCGILELSCTNFDLIKGRSIIFNPAVPLELRKKLEIYNQKILTSLGFRDGCSHFEFFINDQEEPVFLEIAARAVGGAGIPLHYKNSGINFIDAMIYLTLSSPLLNTIKPVTKNNVIAALLPPPSEKGEVIELIHPKINSQYEIDWFIKVGDMINPKSLADSSGLLFAYNDNSDQLQQDYKTLDRYLPVKTKSFYKTQKPNAVVIAANFLIAGTASLIFWALLPKTKAQQPSTLIKPSVAASVALFACNYARRTYQHKSEARTAMTLKP